MGNTYVKAILCEVAWCVTRIRKCYLSAFYWKIKQRRGPKKAIIAVARKLLVIIYNILKENTYYSEDYYESAREKYEERHKSRIIFEAKKLGLIINQPESDIGA
jgi:transposase